MYARPSKSLKESYSARGIWLFDSARSGDINVAAVSLHTRWHEDEHGSICEGDRDASTRPGRQLQALNRLANTRWRALRSLCS